MRFGRTLVRAGALLIVVVLSTGVPAPPVDAQALPAVPNTGPAADAVSSTVTLGAYALNGKVRAAVVDDATGVTYLGGNFTQVGLRTGSVAVVDAPGTSSGILQVGSPEILGSVATVFGDDRPDDPGFLVVGRIAAINGAAVPQAQPVHRVHLVAGAWARDASWSVSGECTAGNIKFPLDMPWIATDTYLIGGKVAGPRAMEGGTTGIVLIDRVTGRLRSLGGSGCADDLLPSIPNLGALAGTGCAAKTHCEAYVGRLAWDPTSARLLVSYTIVVGGGTPAWGEAVAAYDLTPTTGRRTWTLPLQAGGATANPFGSTLGLGALPHAFLVRGTFPLDAGTADWQVSRLLLVDAADGSIVRRWGSQGEQDLADGHVIGPGSDCTNHPILPTSLAARVGDDVYGWVDQPSALCKFSLSGGDLTVAQVGHVSIDWTNERQEPSTPFTSGGTTYLLGSDAAVDVTHGTLATWSPEPAMTAGAQAPGVAVSNGSVVVGGDFRFIHGRSMPGVAALDASLVPLAGFSSPFADPLHDEGVFDLALDGDRLVVGGQYLGGGASSLAALDSATGGVAWLPPDFPPINVDAVTVGTDGGLWVGGSADPSAPGAALRHYGPLAEGGVVLPAPVLACLDVTVPAGGVDPTCAPEWQGRTRVLSLLLDAGGRLTFGGSFGSVDGVTRRGLARLEADGSLSTWDPDLIGSLGLPADMVAYARPLSMTILADNLVVGGQFGWLESNPSGGYFTNELSPILVYSVTSGSLLRPTDAAHASWLDLGGWWPIGYNLQPTEGGLAVALGDPGMGILDATTFDLDVTASAPYLDPNWVTPIDGYAVFALATRTSSAPVAAAARPRQAAASTDVAAPAPAPLVIGGTIARWKNRVAGNVIRTTVGGDSTAPTVATVRATPRAAGIVASGAVPVRISWTGADPHGSGVARYDVSWSVAGAPWKPLAEGVAPRYRDVSLTPGRTYRFRVRATDNAGNRGGWVSGATFTTAIAQQSASGVRYSGAWHLATSTAYLGGSARAGSTSGASASLTFTGRGVGVVGSQGPSRGRMKVYLDGRYVRTVDLRATASRFRVTVFAGSWTTSGRHTIRLVVSGTPGRPRVDLDALVLLR